ncbi:acetylglutamate kinase [Ferroacidibacillus organovorans]|uniref:Acetylglutamate kinase n=1 Tax=Ferroacidibacillus organovorans TaxID=1765683 RepID=A0A101XPW5_9BACL|nr:acetylglutamate kinase [Ferroacidibacillus organovorans]KUO95430.1 hypothetical protein ATW55_02905 [Ferroacidibacillus organovorans]
MTMQKTMVIKHGGSVEAAGARLLKEVATWAQAMRVALVHGGGPAITEALKQSGVASTFLRGRRVTDERTLTVAEAVLAGTVNKRIVRALQAAGANAVGISGEDGGLLTAIPSVEEGLGFVGDVQRVNTKLLETLLQAGFLPVLAPLGLEENGQLRNVNADAAAAAVAGALRADWFIFTTDVAGVKESPDAEKPIPKLTIADAYALIETGVATGGMIPKLEAAVSALCQGAARVAICDGRTEGLLARLLSGEAIGTVLTA